MTSTSVVGRRGLPLAPATDTPSAAERIQVPGQLSHRQILEVMTGLLAALFTALLSTTIVSTALPTIMADLHGTQRQYTWVITSSLLAMTISTPIFGKLSDLFSKKVLVQLSIVLFVIGSVGAGLSQTVAPMMVFRAVQGTAMGGLIALTQSIMGAIIPPRQRGRYSGYMGAVMAVSTVSGPLLGGVITDNANWRWCFFVCVPLAVVALVLLQITLRLPLHRRKVSIDYVGALLIAIVAALPMLWVTFAGSDYAWLSWQSLAFLIGFVVAVALAVTTELRVSEPMVPIRVLRNRTTALMILASVGVGVAMFGSSTFLTQYFQLAGGHSPTRAGLMTIPLIVCQMLSSTIGGQIVSRTGRWKPLMMFGAILLLVGLVGMSTIDHETPYWRVAISMGVMGLGVGALIQNIVLAVQNTVDVSQVGASSATIAFFRSLGGAVGVAILGAVLANHVQSRISTGLAAAGASGGGSQSASDLDLKDLPGPVRTIVRAAYGDSFGTLFLIAAAVSVVTLLAVLFVHEVPLRNTVELRTASPECAADSTAPAAVTAGVPDSDERRAAAALDVLEAAQEQACQQLARSRHLPDAIADRLDRAAHEVDAAVARLRSELDQIKGEIASDHQVSPLTRDGAGGDLLRSYEYGLLLKAQQTADRVTTLARQEAERTLVIAELELSSVEHRISELRQVEAELSGAVADGLRQKSA